MQIQNSTNRIKYFFTLIKQSLRGDQQDYTTGSIRKAVFLLAIPMVFEMMMESVFALVDIFFVGQLGKNAISTVGLTESLLTLVYSLAIGMSMAATAMVARRVGEKNPEAASVAAMQSIIVALFVVVCISIPGFIYAKNILRLMGAEDETVNVGTNYIRIMMAGSVVIMLLFLINGIFRGAGDPSISMKSLWLANICNIIFCPLFIKGLGPIPAFGLTGAAIATTCGRGIGVCYQLFHLIKGNSVIRLKAAHLKVQWDIIKSLVIVAGPGTLQFIIGSCSWIFLTKWVAETGGSVASAGYIIAIRILMFFLLPAWGLSNAAATLVGQNLGANQPKRASDSVIKTAKYNAIFMGIVTVFFFVGADMILSFFTTQPAVKAIAMSALRIVSAGYIFYGVGMVLINAFNGAGDTWTPTIINFFGFWVLQIPLAWYLSKNASMGPVGIFIAIPVAESLMTIASFILFRKGKWKKVKV
ncbi:MAG: MATE family efflux transporter [Ginsengibacter sp.]